MEPHNLPHRPYYTHARHKKMNNIYAAGCIWPLAQGPTGWHHAAAAVDRPHRSASCVWAPDKRRPRRAVGGVEGGSHVLRMSLGKKGKKRSDFKANGSHTWLVQFGTANAHD